MVEIFSADEWETFIEEWLDLKKENYVEIERLGGAGDKGRDVIAYISNKTLENYQWDCFQCKHYDKSLQPTQVYCEFAKILYYTYNKEFPIPKKYYFVAPKGCGTTLSKYLQEPETLKNKIIDNWDNYCKNAITNIPVVLDKDFLDYIKKFDFSIFSKIHIKDIIEEHRSHPNHLTWFGGGLPQRPKLNEVDIPVNVQASETIYIQQLLLAYSSESKISYRNPEEIPSDTNYLNHFKRSRINFHYAEQLRNFSRDSLPPETFDDFQNEIYAGIIDLVEENHENGYLKVKKVEEEAKKLQITSNPLKDVSIVNDRSGVCHQLVNNERIKWVDDEK
jgi:hypothetical protein